MATQLAEEDQEPQGPQQDQSNYDPSQHFVNLKKGARDAVYLPANHRIYWFNEDHSGLGGTIIDTRIIEYHPDEEVTIITKKWDDKAKRMVDTPVTARGAALAETYIRDSKGNERRAQKTECRANFWDYVEKAATGSVARALALVGYGTLDAELEEGRPADAPVETHTHQPSSRPQPQPQPATSPNKPRSTVKDKNSQSAQPRPQPQTKPATTSPTAEVTIQKPKLAVVPSSDEGQSSGWEQLQEAQRQYFTTLNRHIGVLALTDLITYSGLPEELSEWTVGQYEAFASNLKQKTLTETMLSHIQSYAQYYPLPALQYIRTTYQPILGEGPAEEFTIHQANILLWIFGVVRLQHDLGQTLDPDFQHLKEEMHADHPLMLLEGEVFENPGLLDPYTAYLKARAELRTTAGKAKFPLPQAIRDQYKDIIPNWNIA